MDQTAKTMTATTMDERKIAILQLISSYRTKAEQTAIDPKVKESFLEGLNKAKELCLGLPSDQNIKTVADRQTALLGIQQKITRGTPLSADERALYQLSQSVKKIKETKQQLATLMKTLVQRWGQLAERKLVKDASAQFVKKASAQVKLGTHSALTMQQTLASKSYGKHASEQQRHC